MRRRTWGYRSVTAMLLLVVPLLGVLVATTSNPVAAQDNKLSATARASVDDSTLSWGQTTTLRGSGWAPGKTIRVILYAGGQTLASPVAAADGSIVATIRAPSDIASSNKYSLAVQGFGGDGLYGYVAVPLTIAGPTPSISISAKTLHWNDTATVSGVRYHQGSTITISLFPENRTLATAVPGAGNTFDATIRIPSGIRSAKDYQIAVSGEGSDRLFHLDVIQVTIIGDRPTISISSSSVPRGRSLTVTGRTFFKGTSATVTLLPGYEKLGKVPVNDDGSFSIKVTVPDRATGVDPHAILVTGQGQDGIFAYNTARLNIGGRPPAGKGSKDSAQGVLDGSTPPTFDDTFGGTPGTQPSEANLPDAGNSNYLIVILLILLLLAATVAVLVVTARQDVRRVLRRRWDDVLRRLHLVRSH
jgi:hypothetical protein